MERACVNCGDECDSWVGDLIVTPILVVGRLDELVDSLKDELIMMIWNDGTMSLPQG